VASTTDDEGGLRDGEHRDRSAQGDAHGGRDLGDDGRRRASTLRDRQSEGVSDADRLSGFLSVAPSRVAIVLVDLQNDFCEPGALGVDPPINTANATTARRANEFARAAARCGVKSIYTRQVLDLGRLDNRQRRWEQNSVLCRRGTHGAELFVEPVPESIVVEKSRFDIWRSAEFTQTLDAWSVDALVIGGVELQCCVLYAVLGASERGYHYVVPQDLVSGLDSCDATSNRAVRDLLRFVHPSPNSSDILLDAWSRRKET
jgi:nicotinamidase-related amidase